MMAVVSSMDSSFRNTRSNVLLQVFMRVLTPAELFAEGWTEVAFAVWVIVFRLHMQG